MTCPNCGMWAPDDPDTGGVDALCPNCQADGWTEALIDGEVVIINEREDASQRISTRDQYAAFLTEPRR